MDRPSIAWPVPAAFPRLAPDEIHIWCAWLDDPSASGPEAATILSPEEHKRAATFRFDADRRRYVAAHVMTREVIGRSLGADPAGLAFVAGPFGKPSLVHASGLQFNLSHSGPLALLAVSLDQPVGVDLERRGEMPDLALLEERILPPAGQRRQQLLDPASRLRAFYRRWTQLEAVGKFRGTGLDLENRRPGDEHLVSFEPAEGFTGCLACERAPRSVRFFQFPGKGIATPAETTALSHPILPGLPHRHPPHPSLSSS